jgi:hypothetical protein
VDHTFYGHWTPHRPRELQPRGEDGAGNRAKLEHPRPVRTGSPARSVVVDDEMVFFTLLGAAAASALLLGAAWIRTRRRLTDLENRLLDGTLAQGRDDAGLEGRVNDLALRVAQLARGQEFLQHLLSGKRRLPQAGKSYEVTPS